MEAQQVLNTRIFDVTIKIQEQFPALYQILNEMPVTIPCTKMPEINNMVLKEYHESLLSLVNRYLAVHKQSIQINLP